jgi:hypothetical protein
MANGTPIANPGWQDIQGMFAPFASQMMWRLNLGSYADVSANAQIILLRISDPAVIMPPPPFPPLTVDQIGTFRNWVAQGCPETPVNTGAAPASLQAAPAAAPVAGSFRFE